MKKLYSIFILVLAGSSLWAQSDLVLYNFNAVPQSLHTNPAYPQQSKLWIAIPAVSGVNFSYHNNGFALIDLFEAGSNINDNIHNVLDGLTGNSQMALHQEIDLLGFGMRTKSGFWVMGAQQVMDYKMTYPADLMRLLWYGNGHNDYRNSSLGDFDYEVVSRMNYYLGWQQQFMDDKLSLGTRLKYVVGLNHAYAERTNASIETQDNSRLLINTDVLIRTAGVAQWIDDNPFNLGSSLFPENNGFAADVGAVYKYNDHWEFSASVLDLGLINWAGNTREYVSKGNYEFDGLDADLSKDKPIESFDELADSIASAFNFREVDGNSYSRSLSSRVFVGANYHFNEKHALGGLYHARIWEGQAFHDFSVNYQARLSRAFQYNLSYSVINGTYNNVGAGISAKLGPLQLYVMSDNALHAIMLENLRSSSVRVGLNLTFYGKKDKANVPDESPVVPNAETEGETQE